MNIGSKTIRDFCAGLSRRAKICKLGAGSVWKTSKLNSDDRWQGTKRVQLRVLEAAVPDQGPVGDQLRRGFIRHCEERQRRSNPSLRIAALWIASLRSQ
jgi:hypothetical protein